MKLLQLLLSSLLIVSIEASGQSADVEATRAQAEQGDPYAQVYLGMIYDQGKGVPEDDTEAFKWYKRAADQGLPSAQYSMAILYAKGSGVARDDFAAYVWYSVAAVQSQNGAAQARDEIAVKLSAEQIETGQKLVKRCVESGYVDCS